MKGKIEKIWENQTKDKKTYHVVDIGGERYSVWDPKLLEGVSEGSAVEYDWSKSGEFKKITSIQKVEMDPDLDSYKPDRKSMEIIRMSCLRSASEILQGLYIDPVEKTRKALDIAREFENYVKNGDEINRKPKDAD